MEGPGRGHRGAWFLDASGNHIFYPQGFAVLDWESRYMRGT